MDHYKIQSTKSGLKTLVVNRHKNPKRIDMYLMVGIGSDLESGRTLETAHFLEHLFVSLTSSKYPDSKQNREFLSVNNIIHEASTGNKDTIYEYSLDKSKLDKFLDMFVNTIFDFKVDKDIFRNEKNSIIEELHDVINGNSYTIESDISKEIYTTCGRGIPEKKRLENTRKLEPGQVQTYWNKHYRLPYMLLGVYGSIDINSLVNKIDIISKGLVKQRKSISNKLIKLYKPCNTSNNSKIIFTKNSSKLSSLYIYWRIDTNMYHDDTYYLSCINYILSSGDLDAHLIKKLRGDEGLIYDISSELDFDEFQNNLSFFKFETDVESHKLLKVINKFMEVIDNIINNPINTIDFQKYINYHKQVIQNRNECIHYNTVLTEYCRQLIFIQSIDTQKKIDKKYLGIDKSRLQHIAKHYFNTNNLYIAYSGSKNINKQINSIIDKLDF